MGQEMVHRRLSPPSARHRLGNASRAVAIVVIVRAVNMIFNFEASHSLGSNKFPKLLSPNDRMLPLCTLLAAALVPFAGAAGLGLQPRSPAKSYSRRDTPDQACGFTNPVSGSRGLKTVHRLQVSDDLPRRKEHEPVIVKVNLHAGLPSNATDDYVSAEQLYRQFEVLKKECKLNSSYCILPVSLRLTDPSDRCALRHLHGTGQHHPQPRQPPY